MSSVVYHNPDVTHTYYLMIPHADPSEFRVLLRQDGDHWSLPYYRPEEHHFAVVKHINDWVYHQLGAQVSTLRCFSTDFDSDFGERRFYALDNIDPAWEPPPSMRWFTEQDIKELRFPSSLQVRHLLYWFDWRHSDHSLRSPWMRPGWFPVVADWMLDLADRMAMEELGQVEQRRTWARSATLRLNTGDGTLFLKAVPQMFTYEPVITRVLSLRFPENAPDVRAVHVDRGWMLMRDFEGQPLTRVQDIAVWQKTVERYAQMQIELSSSTQSLVALGVPDRNVDYLASQIPRLMNDLPDTLNAEEKQELKRLTGTLRGMCLELTEYNVPLTLTHGDFWSGNTVINGDGEPIFFDWSDASVSHPFFDLPFFLAEIDAELPDFPQARDVLLDAYLQPWTKYEPLDNLRHIFALATVLSGLHQALFYYVHILPGIENSARWEMNNMLPYLLRQVVGALRMFKG